MHRSKIANLVAGERVRRQLSQAAAANVAGVKLTNISRIEAAQEVPLGALWRIAEPLVRQPVVPVEQKPGAWLKSCRVGAGLSLQAVAKRTGDDPSWLRTLESDSRPASPGEVARFCAAVYAAAGKRSLLYKLPFVAVRHARHHLENVGDRLVAVDALLKRYRLAKLQPPDSLRLERLALLDAAALYSELAGKYRREANGKRKPMGNRMRTWQLRNAG